ncbi:hypothetical protein AK812_SmicGene44078, partial [Symbiodinium microadriaticum]
MLSLAMFWRMCIGAALAGLSLAGTDVAEDPHVLLQQHRKNLGALQSTTTTCTSAPWEFRLQH